MGYRRIEMHLAELIEQRDFSNNKFSHRAERQRTQLNHFIKMRSLALARMFLQGSAQFSNARLGICCNLFHRIKPDPQYLHFKNRSSNQIGCYIKSHRAGFPSLFIF